MGRLQALFTAQALPMQRLVSRPQQTRRLVTGGWMEWPPRAPRRSQMRCCGRTWLAGPWVALLVVMQVMLGMALLVVMQVMLGMMRR